MTDIHLSPPSDELIAGLKRMGLAGDGVVTLTPLTGGVASDIFRVDVAGHKPFALKRALADLSTQVIMPNAAPGEPRTLADLGVALTREGNFRLDGQRLQTTLSNNLAGASAMFTTGLFGVFGTVDKMTRDLTLRTNPGTLGGSITRYTEQRDKIGERLGKIAEQQERMREQLVKTFTASDRNVAASQSTLAFLRNQIAAWNAPRN